MEKRTTETIICKFCGKPRSIVKVTDDGFDYCGHNRKAAESYVIDSGCDCDLGRLEYNKQRIKKMCYNCRYFDGVYCNNADKLKELSGMFEMPKAVKVKFKNRCCDKWKVDCSIFRCLLEEE